MSDSNVAERLKSFIEMKGLSYSQFADSCGIPRPSLSQLLTGRNKKINDIMVGQIHNTFPELSIVWLLFGEGEMENNGKGSHNELSDVDDSVGASHPNYENSTNSGVNRIVFTDNGPAPIKNQKEMGLRDISLSAQSSDYQVEKYQKKIKELQQQIEQLKKNPRKAVQIMVYYDDNTFERFYPE